jgi:hypothetical protein
VTTRLDPALGFWLRYVTAHGGLAEADGEMHSAVLPEAVREESGFGELVHVTSDPDIARENAAVLLGPGHPALSTAADRVLAVGDVGTLALEGARRPPDAETLLERARDQFPIDHGRIFPTGSPGPASRMLLRIGALVTYTLSADEQYQEQVEYWIDIDSRLPLSAAAALRLASAEPAPSGVPGPRLSPEKSAAVLAAARGLIDQAALRRREELSTSARKACAEEQQRAEDYYAAQITTLQQRLEALPEEKKTAYRARIEATGAERERRLAEIREKYAPGHDVRPFRAHLVNVPAVHLPAEARRGDRRHALHLDYLTPASEYAGIRCPACSSAAPLVLAKTGFGCENCIARPKMPDAPQPMAPNAAEKPLPAQRSATEPAAKPARPAPAAAPASAEPRPRPASRSAPKTPPPASRRAQAHAGAARRSADPTQRVFELWQAVANDDRKMLDELCEPGSPVATAVRLYGPGGLLVCLELPVNDSPTGAGGEPYGMWRGRNAYAGTVETRTGRGAFMLTWSDDSPPRVEELRPAGAIFQFGLLGRTARGNEAHRRPPKPRVALDPVAERLWTVMSQAYGLQLTLRALAALWRLEDQSRYLARYHPRILAAALDRLVGYWSQATEATYAEAADRHGVAESAIRTAGAALHKELKLTRQRPW